MNQGPPMSVDQMNELFEAAKPLMKLLAGSTYQHFKVGVTAVSAEILYRIAISETSEFVTDEQLKHFSFEHHPQ